jgi:hypothetical protein
MRRFYFVHGGEQDTIIREELASRFIASSEVADVMEEFLFRRSLSECMFNYLTNDTDHGEKFTASHTVY